MMLNIVLTGSGRLGKRAGGWTGDVGTGGQRSDCCSSGLIWGLHAIWASCVFCYGSLRKVHRKAKDRRLDEWVTWDQVGSWIVVVLGYYGDAMCLWCALFYGSMHYLHCKGKCQQLDDRVSCGQVRDARIDGPAPFRFATSDMSASERYQQNTPQRTLFVPLMQIDPNSTTGLNRFELVTLKDFQNSAPAC